MLIIDDLGLKPLRSPKDEDLQDLIAERHERAATLVTSNLDFAEWDKAFPNRLFDAATIDRLRHNAYQLILDGKSYCSPKPEPPGTKTESKNSKKRPQIHPVQKGKSKGFSGSIYPGGHTYAVVPLLNYSVVLENFCLIPFPWAEFRQKKGAIKLHVGLDTDGHLPIFMDMSKGKEHEINWARTLKIPESSFFALIAASPITAGTST